MIKPKKTLQFQFQVTQVTKDAAGECIIEGYANTSTKDRVGDVVLPAAFEKSLPTYLKNPVLLANHDWNDVCGVVQSAQVNEKGLYIRARVSDTRPDIKTLVREGCLRTFSIGYNELLADYDEATKTKYIKEVELLEISIVSVPANPEAMFTQVSTAQAEPPKAEEPAKDALKADEGKQADHLEAKFKALAHLISAVEESTQKSLTRESLTAICDYVQKNEEIMTKEQLLAALRGAKSVEQNAPEAKADAPAAGSPAQEDPMKALSAKLDAIAQALAGLIEKMDTMAPKAEEKPAAEEPAKDGEKAAPACEKCGGEMHPEADKPGMLKCAKCGHEMTAKSEESEEQKDASEELSEQELEKSIAELDEQILALEDEANG